MKIGILGTGPVGQTLGTKLLALGHEVRLGSRMAGNGRALSWVQKAAPGASEGTFADAAEFGELLILAVAGEGAVAAVQQPDAACLAGKVLLDVTNPLEMPPGQPPRLFVGGQDSLAEQVQRAAPQAFVVKALNSVGAAQMVDPAGTGTTPDVFLAGNDPAARQRVRELLQALGWQRITTFNSLEAARFLEPLALLWISYGEVNGSSNHVLQLVRPAE